MYDVIVIGGGPAGSTIGSYLAMAGLKTAVFESKNHPRPHVGESLVPSTTRIFDELGFLPVMEKEGFVRKYGAAWHPPLRKADVHIKFDEFPQKGVYQPYTYHVDRAKFDHLLFKHAESKGADCFQGVSVNKIIFEDNKAVGIEIKVAGQVSEVRSKVVVDASGRHTLAGRQLKRKEVDKNFNQLAIHAWFENVDRGHSDIQDDIHIHFLPVQRGWVWQIPITDKITSIGVVADKKLYNPVKGKHADWFDELINSAPDIKASMTNARQVNDFKTEGDYSYCMDSFIGDGLLLIGDAARFVDPIFSSGVSVAMYSAKFASEAIINAFSENNFDKKMFKDYEDKIKEGTAIWYEFICCYYKLMPLFTHFIKSEKYRQQIHQLLQGEVYDREGLTVLDAMKEYIQQVEESEGHLFQSHLDTKLVLEEQI